MFGNVFGCISQKVVFHDRATCGVSAPMMVIKRFSDAGQELMAMLLDSAKTYASTTDVIEEMDGIAFTIESPWPQYPTPDEQKMVVLLDNDNLILGVGAAAYPGMEADFRMTGDTFGINANAKVAYHAYRSATGDLLCLSMKDTDDAEALRLLMLEMADAECNYRNHTRYSICLSDTPDDQKLVIGYSDGKCGFATGLIRRGW